MTQKSDYLEDAVIQFFLRNDADTFSTVGTLYWAMFSTVCSDAAAGTEMTGGTPAYARVAIAFDDPAGTGDTQNTGAVSVNCSGETVVAVAIMDASTGGNMYYFENFDTPIATTDGNTLDWAAGDISLSEK